LPTKRLLLLLLVAVDAVFEFFDGMSLTAEGFEVLSFSDDCWGSAVDFPERRGRGGKIDASKGFSVAVNMTVILVSIVIPPFCCFFSPNINMIWEQITSQSMR
jgi:hypothetical protein